VKGYGRMEEGERKEQSTAQKEREQEGRKGLAPIEIMKSRHLCIG